MPVPEQAPEMPEPAARIAVVAVVLLPEPHNRPAILLSGCFVLGLHMDADESCGVAVGRVVYWT